MSLHSFQVDVGKNPDATKERIRYYIAHCSCGCLGMSSFRWEFQHIEKIDFKTNSDLKSKSKSNLNSNSI